MTRSKMVLFVILATVGTVAMVFYGATVFPTAPSPFQLAILIFTGIAAIVGFLGLLVSFLTYRLEAGRVPRPDLAIRQPGGRWAKSLLLEATFLEAVDDFEDEVEQRKAELDEVAILERPHPLIGGFVEASFQNDLQRYKRAAEAHLKEYRAYLEIEALRKSFWRRSYVAVFGVTNEKAGVPAFGLRISIRFCDEGDGVRILRLSDVPDRIEPRRPDPPQPNTDLRLALDASRFVPQVGQIDHPDLSPLGNVSDLEIGKEPESVVVSFTVQEVLHNTIETTTDDPIVISFSRPGKWTLPYEIHARNLPASRRGTLTIEVCESDAAASYDPFTASNDNVPSDQGRA